MIVTTMVDNTPTTLVDLDTLILELNNQILLNLKRELGSYTDANSRITVIEGWVNHGTLRYADYFNTLPTAYRLLPEIQVVANHVCSLVVEINHFVPYLLTTMVDPLLKAEVCVYVGA